MPFGESVEILKQRRDAHAEIDNMLHFGMLKAYLDGSLGSHTAALLQPYSDEAGNSGIPRPDQATLNQMTQDSLAAGLQICFHAIGDKGVQIVMDAFAEGEKAR